MRERTVQNKVRRLSSRASQKITYHETGKVYLGIEKESMI